MLLTELLRDPVLDLSFISILDELARLLPKIRKFNCQTVKMSFVASTSNLDSLSSAMLKVGQSSTLIPTHSWKKASSWTILAGSHHHGQVASYPHRRWYEAYYSCQTWQFWVWIPRHFSQKVLPYWGWSFTIQLQKNTRSIFFFSKYFWGPSP